MGAFVTLRARLPAALLTLLFLVPARAVGQRTLHIDRFSADVLVRRNGELIVTERITARFEGQWNGIYRSIPVRYETPQHLNYTLRLKILAATDEAGTALKRAVSSEHGNRKIKIWVPNAFNATHTVTLRYSVANGLRFFDDHDELYWNVTGNDWDVPIGQASAHILLPAEVSGIRATAFAGAYGSAVHDATIETHGNGIDVTADKPLNFREGLTAVVGWNPGVVKRPTAFAKVMSTVKSNGILLLPLIALFLMWRLWYRYGRDPARRAISPAYEPPKDMTPAEVGTLIDHRPDLHDILATLVDLAVRGFLTIEERHDKVLGLFNSTGFSFHLKKARTDWGALRPHEVRMLDAVFERGDDVKDDDLKNHFYQDLPRIRNSVLDRLVEAGHYLRRPDQVLGIYIAVAIFAGAAVVGLGILLNARLGIDQPLPAILAGILTAIVVGVFAAFMPARTVQGARTLEQILGFEEFLRRVESDRFERIIKTPEMFEKYLPYAMALKVDRNWCRAFEGIYRQPPQWYTGGRYDTFTLMSFNQSLSRMASTTGSAMTAAPRSSSSGSSGFSSGGGFSGGGFGGGGGGGF